MSTVTVEITQSVKASAFAYLFIAALEGGSNYWIEDITFDGGKFDPKEDASWEKLIETKDCVRIEVLTEDAAEDGDIATLYVIDTYDLQKALAATVNARKLTIECYNGPGELGDHDAWDADYFLQQLLFKEQVYG